MTDLTHETDNDQPVATVFQPPTAANAPLEPDPAPPVVAAQNPTETNAESALPSLVYCLEVIAKSEANGLYTIPKLPALLTTECPELAEILGSSAIKTNLETYERRDIEAQDQQEQLKHEATLANLCLLGAGLISAIILAVGATFKDAAGQLTPAASAATLLLGLLTLAFGAGAAYFNFVAKDQARVSRWQASRSDAEMARHDIFKTMALEAGGRNAKAALFGLAVVMRDLLEDQRVFFFNAVVRHRKSSETTSRWGGLASALAFVGGSGAIVASQGGASWTNWIILAGVIGAAIGAYAANRDALNRDRANADRYEKTLVALEGLKGESDVIARKIAGGEPKALAVYTNTITDLLATEFKQWQEGTAQAEASLAKLDEQLSQLGKAKGAAAETQ